MFSQSCCKICEKAHSSRNSISFFVKSVVKKVITTATPGRSVILTKNNNIEEWFVKTQDRFWQRQTYRSGNCRTPAPCITNILHWSLEVINQTNQNMPFWKQKRSTLLNIHKQQSCFIQTIWFGFSKKIEGKGKTINLSGTVQKKSHFKRAFGRVSIGLWFNS